MKVVLALGNPGEEYRDTRHNVGWWMADLMARKWGSGTYDLAGATAWTDGGRFEDVEVHKPLVYMNRSGDALAELLNGRLGEGFRTEAHLLVLVDDVALPAGRLRMRAKGSPGGHNGLASISETLESNEWARLRIGVGRPPDSRIDLASWVLAEVGAWDEERILVAMHRAVPAVERWLTHRTDSAMNLINSYAQADSIGGVPIQ